MDEAFITVPVAILSLLLTVASATLAVAVFKKPNIDDAGNDNKSRYYELTSRIAVACNVCVSMAVSTYAIWIIISPTQDLVWFIVLRAIPTLSWFISKASLIWLYNGLLYFTFRKGFFATSRCSFLVINSVMCAAVPICLVLGYTGVWLKLLWLISTGFRGFRLLYLFCTFYLLVRFIYKILILHAYEQQCEIEPYIADSKPDDKKSMVPDQTSFFLHVATKKTVFMTFISISACFEATCWLLFDYALDSNYLTLLLPMMMFSVDGIVNSCCIYMFSQYGDRYYQKWCRWFSVCCSGILMKRLAQKYLNVHTLNLEVTNTGEDKVVTVGIGASADGGGQNGNAQATAAAMSVAIENGNQTAPGQAATKTEIP